MEKDTETGNGTITISWIVEPNSRRMSVRRGKEYSYTALTILNIKGGLRAGDGFLYSYESTEIIDNGQSMATMLQSTVSLVFPWCEDGGHSRCPP
jgi:hypothetical protein